MRLPSRLMPITLAALLLALGAGARGQDADPGAAIDPPDHVARLSYLDGDAGVQPGGSEAWEDLVLNRPLTAGDRLTVAHGARVELELDGSRVRLDGDSDASIDQLDDALARIALTQGTLSVAVRTPAPGERIEIDTPNLALVIDGPATFRLDVDGRAGTTTVTALDGQATAYGDGDSQRALVGGHVYRIDDRALADVDTTYAGARDAFDLWCADREQHYADDRAPAGLPDGLVGAQDLDTYGDWQSDEDYGEVWYPAQVGADWAPYRQGHWAWIAPWGWTWVDDAPWGFAPYHYGRWVHRHDRWGWIPGPRGLRAVYAPALVAFVGGPGWQVGLGSAPIGWFPLGPGDFYDPWYRVSADYYRRVNRHNLRWSRHDRGHGRDHDGDDPRYRDHYRRYRDGDRSGTRSYANRDAPHAVTAVSRDAFGRAGHERARPITLDGTGGRRPPVLGGAAALPPAVHADGHRGPGRRPAPGRGQVVVRHDAPDHDAARLARRFPAARGVRSAPPPVVAMPAASRGVVRASARPAVMAEPGHGTLPTVPRIVPAGHLAPAPRTAAAETRPSERALPVPPRVLRGNDAAQTWRAPVAGRGNAAPVRTTEAYRPAPRSIEHSDNARPDFTPRRFEPRRDMPRAPAVRPEAPRAVPYAAPRSEPRQAPTPRQQFRAVPQRAAPAPAPTRQAASDDAPPMRHAGARFQHR